MALYKIREGFSEDSDCLKNYCRNWITVSRSKNRAFVVDRVAI